MEEKGMLAAIRSNKGLDEASYPVAAKFREEAVKLARRNPTLSEARYFLGEEVDDD